MASPNFVAIRRGQLKFGKFTMVDSDLDLVDADPATRSTSIWVDYQCQLAAGDAHATLQYGWRVRMPDFDKLTAEQCPIDSAPAERPQIVRLDCLCRGSAAYFVMFSRRSAWSVLIWFGPDRVVALAATDCIV